MKNNKLVKLISSFIIGVIFILAVMSVLILTGVISFGKTEITLKTGSKDALYNGSPLTDHTFEMVGELKDGHRIEYEFIGSQTDVGECPNEIKYTIFDELDADVTADYDVKCEYGTLKVNPRIVLVICKDTNGRIPQTDEFTVDKEAYDGLVFDHKLVFRAMTAEELAGSEGSSEESSSQESSGEEAGAGSTTTTNIKWKPVVYDRRNNDVTANYHIIVNINGSGGSSSENIMDSGDLADKMFDSDSNMIPPVGNRNTVLFSVKADNKNKAYLKMQSYGDYNGQSWDAAVHYSELINDRYSAAYLTSSALENANVKSYNMSIISQCGKYALPYYISMSEDNEIQSSDTVVSGNPDSEYQANYYLYSSSARLPYSLSNYEKAYSAFVREQYLTVDAETLDYMNAIIKSEGFDANDPEIITKVAKYIQSSAEYNLEYDRDLDDESNVAIAFLEDYKEGVCSHYSSAATLLYRALGIPARYTVGVVAYPNGTDYVDVPAKNAHAWVEVYIDGLGWTYVEVTGVVATNNVEVGESPTDVTECEMYGHDLMPMDGKEPTCTEDGWTDYFECSREDCKYKEDYEDLDELGHDLKYHAKKDPTCFVDGHEAYCECSRCGELFDTDKKTPIDEIPSIPAEHQMIFVPAKDPTCREEGHEAYFKCGNCATLWDKDGNEIYTIPMLDIVEHKPGAPDPEEHCNVRCEFEGCGELLEENKHPGFAADPNDGNKMKCTNCGDEKRSPNTDGEIDPYRRIYTVITSTSKLIYLRETSYNYVGNGFVEVPDFSEIYEGLPYSPNYLASLVAANSGAKKEQIIIRESVDKGYGLPTYLWFGDEYEQQINDITYEGSVDDPYKAPYYDFDFLGGVEPVIPDDEEFLALEAAYREFVYLTYLNLDTDTDKLAKDIVASQGWSYDRNADYAVKVATINSVANFIRAYREYDSSYEAESFVGADNWAEVFFDKENYPDAKAVCRHYAVSAVAIYKALGIPARYASGVSVQGIPDRVTAINADRRHAWVEVYMDGIGWIIVDATAPSNGESPGVDDRQTIDIKVDNESVKYDNGNTVSFEKSFEVDGDEAQALGLPYGYTVQYQVYGQASKPGKHQVIDVCNVYIFDEEGNNVTRKYKIDYNVGTLHVYRDILYFTSKNNERVFDGKVTNYDDGGRVALDRGTVADGHDFTYTFTANTGVGKFANSFTIKMLDGTIDVTHEYIIQIRPGTVITTPRPITFTAGSASKDYDGTPLTCSDIIYNESDLVAGHWLDLDSCVVEGEETNPTTSDSYNNKIITVVIRDADGNDVSDWYEKTYIPGKLTVIW